MSGENKPRIGHDDGLIIEERPDEKTRKPPLYKVVLHNDDRTPRDFVIHILQKHFKKSEVSASQIMLRAHRSGYSLVGVYTYEVAESRVYKAMQEAEQQEFPLLFTIDQEDSGA